jgi:hypothetical protein
MKKLYTFLFVMAFTAFFVNANAQYVQDFENGMPADYVLYNLDSLEPHPDQNVPQMEDSAWIVLQSSIFGSKVAYSESWYVNDAGPANDWMVLPKLYVGANAQLSFKAMSFTSSGNYPDNYQVLVSTGDSSLNDFQQNLPLLEVVAEDHQAPVTRTIDIAAEGYANMDIWIAFRNNTPSGSGLGIDDINITDAMVGVKQVQMLNNLKLYPNPAFDAAYLDYTLNQAADVQVKMMDVSGRLVQSWSMEAMSAGSNQLKIDLDEVNSGYYVIEILANGHRYVKKLVVQ